jgi:hypothetical protein
MVRVVLIVLCSLSLLSARDSLSGKKNFGVNASKVHSLDSNVAKPYEDALGYDSVLSHNLGKEDIEDTTIIGRDIPFASLNGKEQVSSKSVIREINSREKKNDCTFCFWSILGSIFGALISGIVALYIYRRGEKQKERQDKKKEAKELEGFGSEIYILTKNSIVAAKTQYGYIIKYVDEIKETPYSVHSLKKVINSDLKRLKELDFSRIHKLFMHLGKSSKTPINFINNIDFLNEVFVSISVDSDKNNKESVVPFSNKFLQIREEILMEVLNARAREEISPSILVGLEGIVTEYFRNPLRTDAPDIHFDFVNLTNRIAVFLLEKNAIIMSIATKAKEAGNFHFGIKYFNENFMLDVSSQIENIKKAIDGFEKLVDELEGKYGDLLDES